MDQIQQQHHVEDVGRILLQTQEQLRLMREQVASTAAATTPTRFHQTAPSDVTAFQEILQRAELEIRAKAELVLNGLVNTSSQAAAASTLSTLPAVVPSSSPTTRKRNLGALLVRRQSRSENNEMDLEYFRSRMISLINRGFVPVGADLTPAFVNRHGSIIKDSKTRIYNRQEQPIRSMPHTNPSGFNMASLKFDLAAPPERASSSGSDESHVRNDDVQGVAAATNGDVSGMQSVGDERSRGANVIAVSLQGDGTRGTLNAALRSAVHSESALFASKSGNQEPDHSSSTLETHLNETCHLKKEDDDDANAMDDLRKNVEKIRGYNELLDAYSLHQFIIHKGKAMRETPEFVSFKRVAQEIWGSVEEVIKALETLLTRYFVLLAYVDWQRLTTVASMEIASFSKQDLLSCIANEDQVGSLIRRPGQRYKGNKGKDRKRRAAITIQNVFRIHEDLKRKLKAQREQQHEQWEVRMQRLRREWPRIKASRRVIIHVPSLSIDERFRIRADNFAVKQNLQLSRFCGIIDANVDIVYVSPFELTSEVGQYFMKLLQLGGIADPVMRAGLVFPEQATRFPAHFSLTTVLLYSPHCLRRIGRCIKGKEAYLVTGMPGQEEKRLAMTLNVPILGVDPLVALPLMTKSGSKRFFMRADVNVPMGTYDVYDEDELIFSLAKLIVSHIEQNVWLLKIDYDPFGTGTAIVDASAVTALREIRREKKSPEYWRQPGTRDNAARMIIAELERTIGKLVTPLHPEVYPTWQEFSDAISQFGVVIEASPSAIVGHIRANLFVKPSGEVHVSSTQDVILSTASIHKRRVAGYAFPQTTAPYETIRVRHQPCVDVLVSLSLYLVVDAFLSKFQGASMAIGKVLVDDSVFGYSSVDYLVFREDKTHVPRLWAMALHPYLTDSASTFAAFHLLNRGTLNVHTEQYHLPAPAASGALSSSTASSVSLKSSASSVLAAGSATSADLVLQEATHSGLVSLEKAGTQRTYVVNEYIFHPNVSTMQYSSFFHTCRLHGVCFGVERCFGTIFLLADSLTVGVFGIICCGDTASAALGFLRTAFEVIGREVGTQALTDDFRSGGDCESGNFAEVLAVVRALTGGKSAKLEKIRRLRRRN
ncbi:hypothetical protein FI667_g5504, partial [Globisporangium splendens]